MSDEEAKDGEEAPKKKKMSGKKLIMFVGLPIILLVGLYMSGILDSVLGGAEEEGEEHAEDGHGSEQDEEARLAELDAHSGEAFYFEVPELTVNLRSDDRRAVYLQLEVTLETPSEQDLAEVERLMPRVVDQFQTHLRELHASDIEGSAAVYRLREELLNRVNDAIAPARISDVLFGRMLVQG